MKKLATWGLVMFLTAGCFRQQEPVPTEALFCDVEEKRRFSQEEVDWRSENAPWNLRRDFATNLTYERECEVDDGLSEAES